MRIPPTAHIPLEKITAYLLVPRRDDDKSKFLSRGGFKQASPHLLLNAILAFSQSFDAMEDVSNQYGVFYVQQGPLIGPNGLKLYVKLVWLQKSDGTFSFITLKPWRRNHEAETI